MPAALPLRLVQFSDLNLAVGTAVRLMLSYPAFAQRPFGPWVGVIDGQARRGHQAFVVDAKNRAVGFLGFAFVAERIADEWARGLRIPTFDECIDGDCLLINACIAEESRVLSYMWKALRPLVLGRKAVYYKRFYPDGRVRAVRLPIDAAIEGLHSGARASMRRQSRAGNPEAVLLRAASPIAPETLAGPALPNAIYQGLDEFDHMGDAWTNDAPALWADLRGRCPVAKTHRHGGLAVVTRYDDLRAIAYDPKRFSSRQLLPFVDAPGKLASANRSMPPATSDAPHHRRERMALIPALSPSRMKAFEPAATALANLLLTSLAEGEVDASQDFAHPFALRAVCRTLGFDDADVAQVGHWVDAAVAATPEETELFDAATTALLEFCRREVEYRIGCPGDDLVSLLLSHRPEGLPAAPDEIRATLRTLLIAGIDTTASMIGFALHHLTDNPDLGRAVGARPDLLPDLIEELLRLGSPPTLGRSLKEDVRIGDRELPAGSMVLLAFGAANRDPAAFPNPDSVVFGRPSSPQHLAFGAGIHRCVGHHLARLLVTVAVREWLATFASFAGGSQAMSWSRGLVRGPKHLPLVVKRAAGRGESDTSAWMPSPRRS